MDTPTPLVARPRIRSPEIRHAKTRHRTAETNTTRKTRQNAVNEQERAPLACRSGLHRWTADANQGPDELSATFDCYCLNCHMDRFDESGRCNTRIDRIFEAVWTTVVPPVWRIISRLTVIRLQIRAARAKRRKTRQPLVGRLVPAPKATVPETSSEPTPGTPVMIIVINQRK